MRTIFTILCLVCALYSPAIYAQRPVSEKGELPGKITNAYPSPATSQITIELLSKHQKGQSLEIYSFIGVKVFEKKNIDARTLVQLNDFIRGVYIYRVIEPNGTILDTGKFQVSK